MGKIKKLLAPLIIGFVLVGVLAATLNRLPVQAAPLSAGPVQVFTLNSTAVATSTTWTATATGGRWSALGTAQPSTAAEVWLTLDMGTVNTVTFALQVSPDNTTWIAHNTAGALATDLAADANQYTAVTIHGAYYRVVMTATNSNTLTPTIKVVVR